MRHELEVSGFVLCPGAVGESSLRRLLEACVTGGEAGRSRHPSGATYGIRGLLWSSPRLRSELNASGLSALARTIVGSEVLPVDAIFFDKQPDANWSVPGHQDRLMPIERGSAAPKAIRHGIAYAEPSRPTLAALVAVRVHFDDVGSGGGALEVVPGSHRAGLIGTEAIRAVPLTEYRACVASRGDVLVLRPLLLHRSGRRADAGHRRVLHIVYAPGHPSDGLRWRSSAELPLEGATRA